MKTDAIDVPLTIRFSIKDDPTHERATFVVGDIQSGDILDVVFFNVTNNGSSGLKEPAEIINLEDKTLLFMFRVECAFKTESYLLHYEFFEVTKVVQS